MGRTVLAVDPGGTSTGIVIRRASELLWHATVTGGWRQVLEALAGLPAVDNPIDMLAVEDITPPGGFANGRRQPINLAGLIGTSITAGAVAGWGWSDGSLPVVMVPPGHNGQGALEAYPVELRPTRGQGRGADGLRHCRSAWDVAGTAAVMAGGRVTV